MARSQVTSRSGFTVPELLVAMIVMTILSAAVVGTTVTWLASYTTSGLRVQTSTDLRFSLSKISTDISQSYIAQASPPSAAVADTTPPMPVGGWVGGDHVLILGKTPRSSVDGSALYATPDTYEGDPDSVIYYLSGTDLYRRIVPVGGATYPNNALGTAPSQTKVLSDVTAFDVGYYDGANNPSAIADAVSISVLVTATRMEAGKTLTYTDKIQVALRVFANITPPDVNIGTVPNPQTVPALTVGYGGLSVYSSNVSGPNIHVKGKISAKARAKISMTGRVDVENKCYISSTYNTACSGSNLAIDIRHPNIARVSAPPNSICGVNQTSGYNLTGWTGGTCTPPSIANLPSFDKSTFISSLTGGAGPTSISCMNQTVTIPASVTISGSVSVKQGCTLKLSGNVHIMGGLSVSGGVVVPDVGVTTNRPVVVVDGTINFRPWSKVKKNNYVAPIFISYYASDDSVGSPTAQDRCKLSSPTPMTDPQINSVVKSEKFDFLGTTQAIGVYSSRIQGSLYAACDTIIVKSSTIVGALAGHAISVSGQSSVRLTPGIWPTN